MFFQIIQEVFTGVAALALLAFAGITLGSSAVALAVSTPFFVLFSPILVPATIATTLLTTGLSATGGLGLTAIRIIWKLYKRIKAKGGSKIPGLAPGAPDSKPASGG
ncbi:glycine-rich protein 19 [Raphanus sativus]|nr:glycine-rich protein 19 [Raphanus sativus]